MTTEFDLLLNKNKISLFHSGDCIARSEEAKFVFFCFCNLYFFLLPLAASTNLEGQNQKYSPLRLHPAKISLHSSSHHIRILIYSIWL